MYALSDFVEGEFHKDAALSQVSSPQQRFEMYSALVDSLARIHAVNVDAVGLSGYGKRRMPEDDISQSGYVARQVKVGVVRSSIGLGLGGTDNYWQTCLNVFVGGHLSVLV